MTKPQSRNARRRAASGFTLTEILIAVAIVGILATVALPSYQGSMVKSRRADAQSYLVAVAQQEQQFFIDNRAYTGCLVTSSACPVALNLPIPAAVARSYTVAVTVSSTAPPGFTVTATPLSTGPQASDGALSIDHTGAKTPSSKW